ncbi:MAG TPA: hypothetical protein VGJ66_06560 [Pyrinomonadaceae bacterium]|jgi:MFS family permease
MNTEQELEKLLSNNLILRLLLRGRYRWAGLAVAFAIVYFVFGAIIAATNHALIAFVASRFIYVLLIAIIACVTSACWYPRALIEVIAATPQSFKIETEAVLRIVKDWMKLIRLPITLTFGMLLATGGVGLILFRKQVLGLPASYPPWLLAYVGILLAICGVMLGGGVIAYLATMVLYRQLFRFQLRLSHYRRLAPLSTFSARLTILAFIAVALLLLLVFDQIRYSSIVVLLLGLMGGVMMFALAQYSFQSAVLRAKREYLYRLTPLYEKHYEVLLQPSVSPEVLQDTQKGLDSLNAIEKHIQSIPIWLVELSDVTKVVWSSFIPILSLLLNPLLSKLGL